MMTLRNPNERASRRPLPIAWHRSAWTVRILVRPAAPSFRRLGTAVPEPIGPASKARSAYGPRGSVPGRSIGLAAKTPLRPIPEPLRGSVSRHRRLSCDPAGLRRLAAFASLPLSGQPAPRVRVFRVFKHPQFAL